MDALRQKVREYGSLADRLIAAKKMICSMASEARPPRMRVPCSGEVGDEDIFIDSTLSDAHDQLATLEAVNAQLRLAVMVGVVQLYDTNPKDVLARFTLEELEAIVKDTDKLRPRSVEDIYHAALYPRTGGGA